MFIQAFPSGPLSTNAYVVACSNTRAAAIIDPAPDSSDLICQFLEKNQFHCQALLLTHSHWDHIADVVKLKNLLQIPIYIHSLDVPNLENPGADMLPCFIPITGTKADFLVDHLLSISIGSLNFKVIHTPGHSPGSVCFYESQQHTLFSGDTLFKRSIGNISFPTSQPHLMWDSLKKLAVLPANTQVFPGHGSSTTIGQESWLSDPQKYFG